MFHKIFISICLSVFSFSAIAQDNSPHHIGVSSGITTGFGLSYRYWPSKLGLQITTLPTLVKNSGSFTSFGASALYMINDTEKIDLYGYLGNSIFLVVDNYDSELAYKLTYNAGLGFGLKFDVFDQLNINIQLGYGGIDIGSDTGTLFSIVGETGLYYHF